MNHEMNSRWLRWCLTCIVVLLAVIAIELSVLVGPVQPRAAAMLPDSGLQRKEMIQHQVKTNALLERSIQQSQKLSAPLMESNKLLKSILKHLEGRTIKVKVMGTDKDIKSSSKKARTAQPAS